MNHEHDEKCDLVWGISVTSTEIKVPAEDDGFTPLVSKEQDNNKIKPVISLDAHKRSILAKKKVCEADIIISA